MKQRNLATLFFCIGTMAFDPACDSPRDLPSDGGGSDSNNASDAAEAGPVTAAGIEFPTERTVFQRDGSGRGNISVDFRAVNIPLRSYDVRLVSRSSSLIVAAKHVDLSLPLQDSVLLSETISVPQGGWYELDVLQTSDSAQTLSTVSRVGVGEVFLTAGQSNSANHEQIQHQSKDDRVVAYDVVRNSWLPCADPQPFASGVVVGSVWPELGDALASDLNVPIGFVSTGVAGTSITDWQKGAPTYKLQYDGPTYTFDVYKRLIQAIQSISRSGIGTVLWDQGETDALHQMSAATYEQKFTQLQSDARGDTGLAVPWIIARASYMDEAGSSGPCVGQDETIRASSLALTQAFDDLVSSAHGYRGPDTDVFAGPLWRYSGPEGLCVHFASAAQSEVSRYWARAVETHLGVTGTAYQPVCVLSLDKTSYQVGDTMTATVLVDWKRLPSLAGTPADWTGDAWYGSKNGTNDLGSVTDFSSALTNASYVDADGRAGHVYQFQVGAAFASSDAVRYVEPRRSIDGGTSTVLCRTTVAHFKVQ